MIKLTIYCTYFPMSYQFALNGVKDDRKRPSLRAAEIAAKKLAAIQFPGQQITFAYRVKK